MQNIIIYKTRKQKNIKNIAIAIILNTNNAKNSHLRLARTENLLMNYSIVNGLYLLSYIVITLIDEKRLEILVCYKCMSEIYFDSDFKQ